MESQAAYPLIKPGSPDACGDVYEPGTTIDFVLKNGPWPSFWHVDPNLFVRTPSNPDSLRCFTDHEISASG